MLRSPPSTAAAHFIEEQRLLEVYVNHKPISPLSQCIRQQVGIVPDSLIRDVWPFGRVKLFAAATQDVQVLTATC